MMEMDGREEQSEDYKEVIRWEVSQEIENNKTHKLSRSNP